MQLSSRELQTTQIYHDSSLLLSIAAQQLNWSNGGNDSAGGGEGHLTTVRNAYRFAFSCKFKLNTIIIVKI